MLSQIERSEDRTNTYITSV